MQCKVDRDHSQKVISEDAIVGMGIRVWRSLEASGGVVH